MLKIQRYEGMASDYAASKLENYYVTESKGWKPTRLSGVLAVVLAGNPGMPIEAVAAFAHANGHSDWEFNLDTGDGTLIADDGTIYFLEDYPLPSDWQSLWNDWKAGYEISELPREYVQPAAPAQPVIPPSSSEPSYSDEDYYMDDYYNQPAAPASQPAQPVPANYNQPSPSSSSQTSSTQPPAQNAAYVVQPTTQKKSDIPWMWIGVGAVALIFLMKKKKKR